MEFRIKALDNAHGIVACVIDAVDEADARRQLALKEFRVISLSPVRHLRLLARAPQLQLAVFSQQLVSLLDAGLSLVEALEALAERESTTGAHRTLERVLGRLYEGQTLATALTEHPRTFPPLYVASVRASERTGALREALTRYIAYEEQADALRKTLVNACIYPAVLLGAGLLVTLFLMGYVVPRFSAIYADVGTDLPAASRLLLQWGQLMDEHAGLIVDFGALRAVRLDIRADPAASTRGGRRLGRAHSGYRPPTTCLSAGASVSHHGHAAPRGNSGGFSAADVFRTGTCKLAGRLRSGDTVGTRGAINCTGDGAKRAYDASRRADAPRRGAQRQHGRDDGADRVLL